MVQLGLHWRSYPLHEVTPYINWAYFFHAWGFSPKFVPDVEVCDCEACQRQWISNFPITEQQKANEARKHYQEAKQTLNELDAQFHVHAVVRLMECNSENNDILLYLPEGIQRFPLLRQQSGTPPYLCLNDFIRPAGKGRDIIGLFATTVDSMMEQYGGEERQLMIQTLADRLAEAAAEKLHEEVRKTLWGYAPDEDLTPHQMNNEEFQGIRPAVGYPSLPDISINWLLAKLIDMESIGIRLTENAMMQPHASVSGLMLAHPKSRYFSVGKIGQDQMEDYAHRRGYSVKDMSKFLTRNIE